MRVCKRVFLLAMWMCCGAAASDPSREPTNVVLLEQQWTPEEREEFYFTAQGSQLIPFKWFLALEQADCDVLFRNPTNIRKYGFLPAPTTERNPHGLPIGFVRDGNPVLPWDDTAEVVQKSPNKETTRFEVMQAYLGPKFDRRLYPKETSWFGLTCAACHTHEMVYQGHTIRIDGGSSQADIETFLRDMGAALDATWQDEEKLERFSKAVGRGTNVPTSFADEVHQIADAVNRLVQRNRAEFPYGYARLDAFGAILNAVCETALEEPANNREANAPVSYPSLWNTPHMSHVQWNASAENAEARNVGEVLGVFGTYTLAPGEDQFDSTVRLKNLIHLEHELVAKLRSPDWPEQILGALDPEKVKLGKRLFHKNCISCHAVRDELGQFDLNSAQRIPIRSNTLAEVGTDPQFLLNLTASAKSGVLAAALGKEEVKRVVMLGFAVRQIIANRIAAEQVALPPGPSAPQQLPHPDGIGVGYIARPLEGIWTNAPYFHNGSVPNLYETLLPSAQRSTKFWVGGRKFDVEQVGFATEETGLGSLFRVFDDEGQPIPGNSNAGHEGHGNSTDEGFTQTFEDGEWRDFTDQERYALIEYMKSLSSRSCETSGEVAEPLEIIPDDEPELIKSIVKSTATRMRAMYSGNQRMLRGVHPKDHGCVTARFDVLPDVPPEYAVGVFQPGSSYPAFIRFSNADVVVRADSALQPDGKPQHGSRGMAIKLLGVQGKSLLPLHGALTQDFVMINQPVFAFANVEDYELLSRSLLDPVKGAANFFEERKLNGTPEQQRRAAQTARIVQRIRASSVADGAFFEPPASPVDNPYFSAAPFLFGEGRAMKFRASPTAPSTEPPNVNDPNYLRTALIERLKSEAVVFDFAIQVRCRNQLDLPKDIENASHAWDDEFIKVATITIPPQNFDSPEQRVKCERLFFTPWHGIPEHRPLGGINRLRKAVYLGSGKFRSLPKEPSTTLD